MKKKSEKKLGLGKIKIASLSKPGQHLIYGGRPNNDDRSSANHQCCATDVWAQCRRHTDLCP